MAGRKEYNMLFQLNAQLGSGYNSTFKSAQDAIASIQRELQDLSKIQSDISAYQKQQSAIEATKAKLENLKKQQELTKEAMGEAGASKALLARDELQLKQNIKKTESALERQQQKLDATSARLKDAGVDTSNLAQKDAELTNKIRELTAQQDKAADSAATLGEKTAQAFETVGQAIAAAGIAVALKEISQAYMECVNAAGNFEESMSTVKALSEASAGEMAQLSDMAKELGATTKFTAKESADAMGFMGMAGWDASEMLSGMDGVLQLSAASGEELARVSDIVTDSLTAFGLTAADTAHFSDVLAAAATNSNTNVSTMGETFKMSASVAGALGYSVEDVAVAVGLMANTGVKGSIAGTALRNTFNGLLEGVTLTSDAFGEYEYSAIKADGTMKSFGETIDELRVYFEQMSKAERITNAKDIAGLRGYNGLLGILNATDESYQSLSDTINNCSGAAAKMASIKLDNMNGQLTLAKSAWDALKMSIGEQFTPVMRRLYEIAAQVFGELSGFVAKNPAMVRAIGAFVAVFGTLITAIGSYVAIAKIAKAINFAALFSGPAGVVLAAAAGVAAFAAGIAAVYTAATEAIPSVGELTKAAGEMQDVMAEAGDAYNDTAASTLAAANVADTYITKLEEMQAAGIRTNEEHKQYHNTLALLCQVVPDLADSIDLETDKIDGGTAALRANTEAWKKNALQQAYQEQLAKMYQGYSAVLIEAEENSIGLTKAQYDLESANKKQSDTLARMDLLYGQAQKAADEYSQKFGGWADATLYLTQEYYDLENTLDDIDNEIWIAEQSIKNYTEAVDKDSEAIANAEEEMNRAEEAVRHLTGAVEAGGEISEAAAERIKAYQNALNEVISKMHVLSDTYDATYRDAYDSITGQFALWDKAPEVVAMSIDQITAAMESQSQRWQNYDTNLNGLLERSRNIEGLREMIASFADGSEESINAVAGLAEATDTEIKKAVSQWQELKQEQKNVSASLADLATDFSFTMEQIVLELASAVTAMNFGGEAKKSAEATIKAYIEAVRSMVPDVRGAYAQVARAAQDAASVVIRAGTGVKLPGYAAGTRSADPGFAVVGELGPELVYFNGGEQVMTAAETAAMQSRLSAEDMRAVSLEPHQAAGMTGGGAMAADRDGGYVTITFAPVYTISGVPDADGLQSILQSHDENMRDYILQVVEEAGIDRVRRAYT